MRKTIRPVQSKPAAAPARSSTTSRSIGAPGLSRTDGRDVWIRSRHDGSGSLREGVSMNIKASARRFTAALFAMLLIGGLCGSAGAQTAVSSCQTLSVPGNYFLTKNLAASGDCLVIAAPNVAIDLKGKMITGNGSNSG